MLILSSHVDSGDRTQVDRVDGRVPYQLSNLTGPTILEIAQT